MRKKFCTIKNYNKREIKIHCRLGKNRKKKSNKIFTKKLEENKNLLAYFLFMMALETNLE